jgi:hypothetical protein
VTGARPEQLIAGPRRAACWITMIAKTFIMTEEIHAIRAKSLRDNKFIRDHWAIPLIRS